MGSFLPVVLPPLIALALLLTLTYLLLPLYRQRARYSSYMPIWLPSQLELQPHSRLATVRDWLLDRIAAYTEPLVLRGHRRTWSGLSDEEMIDPVEGLEELHEHVGEERARGLHIPGAGSGGERRLSRDLEAGFRDDSDDEEEHEQEPDRGRRGRGGR